MNYESSVILKPAIRDQDNLKRFYKKTSDWNKKAYWQHQEINNNKAMISRNHDLTNNEIESINGNHAKLKAAHEKLKAEVEAQNKFNSDNQVDITVKIIDKKLTIIIKKIGTFAS